MAELAGVRHARISTPQGESGVLSFENGRYLFTCTPDAPPAADISLLMPHRAEQYARPSLHPIFQMNLPEGYVLVARLVDGCPPTSKRTLTFSSPIAS